MQIGFVGTGTIASAMVHGLAATDPAPSILVSPRSATLSEGLAARYPNVRRAASNKAAATAEIVVLGMRPTQVEEALADIAFGPHQIVLSLVAGFGLADVQKLAPHSRVARAVPMPGIARRDGPITLYPGLPELVTLLAPLGDLIVARSETELNMGGVNAFMSTYFELQQSLIGAATAAGVPEAEARTYVVSLLSMLARTARETPAGAFGDLVTEHQTKGGLNERVRARLLAAGWFGKPAEAFAEIGRLNWQKLG